MKFMILYPVFSDREDGAWVDPGNIATFARVAEESGADAIAFIDHPAPPRKWLIGGGHETFDPFVALGFCAAVTTRIRLMTYLAVLPYRNPLLQAKSMTSVDVLSRGRATFVLGTGYLRSEFAALGVEFEERNELFDEAIEVMHGAWASDEFRYQGAHFRALGTVIKPPPVQRPHPPLWLGGNARVVRERVAQWGQGWAPLQGGPQLSQIARTRDISSRDDLARLVRGIRARMEELGRDPAVLDVIAGSGSRPGEGVDEQLDAIGGLSAIGVTWTQFPGTRESFPAALDSLRRYGEEVVSKARAL
jgi:probable F420-dependent oxidoreductase